MHRTIFNTPIITPLLRALFALGKNIAGWKVVTSDSFPPPPCVIIVVPHTSNWDFAVLLFSAFHMRLNLHWMGKHTIFRPPFAGLMRWMGGIPINRNSAGNIVKQIVDKFNSNENLMVLIPPEGTRKKVPEWKSGFYHIACNADIPIAMVCVDAGKKEMRFLGTFKPSGDYQKDLPLIKNNYQNILGINPENT